MVPTSPLFVNLTLMKQDTTTQVDVLQVLLSI